MVKGTKENGREVPVLLIGFIGWMVTCPATLMKLFVAWKGKYFVPRASLHLTFISTAQVLHTFISHSRRESG
jgi:hypothetical protein